MSLTHQWIARADPDRPALSFQGQQWSHGALAEAVERARQWLEDRGVAPGHTVAIQCDKDPGFVVFHLALMSMGAITLPLNPAYPPAEVQWLLRDSTTSMFLGPDGDWPCAHIPAGRAFAEAADCPPAGLGPAIAEDRIGVLCYTSGTTGRPKGALIRQGNIGACVRSLHGAWGWTAEDVLLHALPVFHVHGLFVAQWGALWAGAHSIWHSRFDAQAFADEIPRSNITVAMGVPTFWHRLRATLGDRNLSSLRLITSGSAPLAPVDWEAIRALTGLEIVERYGMTEVGIVMSNPLDGPRKPGSIGVPLPGVEARLMTDEGGPVAPDEVGELHIRAGSVFAGYLNRPDATAAAVRDGWMATGDLGRQDQDGYVYLMGRRTEVVIRGGLNVYPAEVEAVLGAHSSVGQVAVFGVPDPDLGERVHAAYEPVDDIDPSLILDWLAPRLARYKRPEALHPVASLPTNAMGKVIKSALRDAFGSTS